MYSKLLTSTVLFTKVSMCYYYILCVSTPYPFIYLLALGEKKKKDFLKETRHIRGGSSSSTSGICMYV